MLVDKVEGLIGIFSTADISAHVTGLRKVNPEDVFFGK